MSKENCSVKKCSCSVLRSVKNFVSDNAAVLLVATVAVGSYKLRKTLKGRELRRKWDSAGKDVVVLHAGGPARTVPHSSPYALKLDTYLKMAGITFKHDNRQPFGPMGKLPWITLNGEDLADSQLIMEHLGEKFGVDLDSHLTPSEKAVARSIRLMIEDHLVCAIGWWRFVADREYHFVKDNNLPWIAGPVFRLGIMRQRVRSKLWSHGIGRHSEGVFINMMTKDIEALSVYIGDKKFIMSDEPCELDCTVFGFLSVILWGCPGNPWIKSILENYPNLEAYCNRVKERFYPDWEQRLRK